MFPSISPKQSFPALESEILAYWKANNTFKKSIESRPEDNPYRFYDGPPFITGTPHYGSLLSSIVKDVVGRYWTMRGKRVDRIWGWDCHGLPIEEKVQKKLGLKSNKDIEERGVKEFIDGCYEYTQSTSAEWDWYIDKIGRWVDMDRAYRTMDQDYMESVMWVFSQLWNKGLIYEGKRVSLYSWKLSTPISNFEVAMDDTYQDVNDPAITVKFKLEKNDKFPEGTNILAWTTTPWTIPANMALAIGEKITYALIENNGENYIVATTRTETVFKGKGEYIIVREFSGSELVGLSYLPPFPEYYHGKTGDKSHKVYAADFATDTDGTGIVHIAPEFGDVDFGLAKEYGIPVTEAVDEAGKYTAEISTPKISYEGVHYLDLENPELGANKINIERMKANNTLFKLEGITHRVPFCPRSGTPLMQRAQSSWFINIQSQKEKLLEANQKINWFPEYLKEGRFAKGIESAPDWCISRTRFWGAPMPVWIGEDGEQLVVSSREEIFELNKPFGQLTKLIISRHAESVANVEKHYDDTGLSPLSENGKNQAESLMNELKDKGIDIIITSPFLRAIQTAEPLAKKLGIEIITREELKETGHGNLANASSLEKFDEIQTAREQLFGDDKNAKFGETGESYHDIETRMKKMIDEVCEKYPGKTVFIVSHGFPVRIATEYLTGKKTKDGVKNAEPKTFILDVANKNLLNLHRPYIDSILLQNSKAKKAQKILGIHGFCRTDSVIDFLAGTRENLAKEGVEMNTPIFEKGEKIDYKNWEKKFDELHISEYDTILTHSMGSRAAIEYIIENRISLDRLIMVSPAITSNRPEVISFYDAMKHNISEVKKYTKEIIILHSKDDSVHTLEQSRDFAEKVGGKLIVVDGFNHFNVVENSIIEGIVKFGTPLNRTPEVLDVWMDSGSMPYAQMHYPFENKGEMEASFPADFIAEYVGQVRAWFYVMHVLGVLLNPNNEPTPTPSFTNVITTGVINGNDGRKMSKSFGNYPDPRITIEKYGADPIRFYMLNSPLLSGGDMDFKEEGIMETIKGVMLPIWNTYSFFTTYANIDGWEKDETEMWFSRHAESESNVIGKMSDGTDNPNLTEKGRGQAKSAGEKLREQGKNFDVIIHTDRIRAEDTAKIIGTEVGFTGEYIIHDGFAEQSAGEYANKTHTEILEMAGLPPDASYIELRKVYKNNSVENLEQFEKRILVAYEDILSKYKGKRVLIVAHAGTSRPILANYMGMDKETANYNTTIHNADPYRLTTTKIVNPLDRWILSKLQVLIGQVHDAMEGYDVSRACRAIVDYMDELTNWYVRLSRRRFWGSEMTADKASGYETLHTVLVEVSKLLAPYMPFLAESIFQGLTKKESVHLEYVTFPNRHLVSSDLNRDMEICEHIVSLGLALRSRKNIRVRQPLQTVTITQELDEYYQSIIRDELNVKEVRFENPERLAKKICKPDARKIGPKYGKRVQIIIQEAKAGNFIELGNGRIEIKSILGLIQDSENNDSKVPFSDQYETFILEAGEYTMEYLPLEGIGDVEGGYGMVISLDTTISESLKLEGYARDLIRAIQEMRKEADYQVTDRISLHIFGEKHEEILASFGEMIQSETLASLAPLMVNPDLQKEVEIDEGITLTLQIEK